jgi:hypothetical protein
MSITPKTPADASREKFKHGSNLSGNARPKRVSSQWQSTIVKLNETAAAIIECATHASSIGAAASDIASRYSRADLEPKILGFLEDARAKGWIRVKS